MSKLPAWIPTYPSNSTTGLIPKIYRIITPHAAERQNDALLLNRQDSGTWQQLQVCKHAALDLHVYTNNKQGISWLLSTKTPLNGHNWATRGCGKRDSGQFRWQTWITPSVCVLCGLSSVRAAASTQHTLITILNRAVFQKVSRFLPLSNAN